MTLTQILVSSVAGFHAATAYSSNVVNFLHTGSVTFQEQSHAIGSSSDWDGITSSGDSLTVRANRHGSSVPASVFKKDLGPGNMIGNRVRHDTMPALLNFAIVGTLGMNVDGVLVHCPDIRIGQGHTKSGRKEYNNWWMGGKNCYNDGDDADGTLKCPCSNGAILEFETVSGSSNRFSTTLTNRCAVMSRRSGYWSPVTASQGNLSFSFTSASKTYTEKDFETSLSVEFGPKFEFGHLDISAEATMKYIQQMTTSTEWTKTCNVAVPPGKRLWQWTYEVITACGANRLNSCYFFALPINSRGPCCLVGYQTDEADTCTEKDKYMCESELAEFQI